MIYGHLQSTGACDTAKGLSDLFSICLQDDDVKDFDTRWDQILLGTSEMPPENVLEGLQRKRLQGSEQLQTVFAMYNQELSRGRVEPSYQKSRKMVRRHIDQTIRTRNFKARNERIEPGVLVKSQKGRNVSAERKMGEETPVVFSTGVILVNGHNHPLLLQERRRQRLAEESPTNMAI